MRLDAPLLAATHVCGCTVILTHTIEQRGGFGALHDGLCDPDGRSLIFIGVGGVSVAYSMPLALCRLLPRIWPLQAAGDQGMCSAASQTVLERPQSFLEPLQRNANLSKNI